MVPYIALICWNIVFDAADISYDLKSDLEVNYISANLLVMYGLSEAFEYLQVIFPAKYNYDELGCFTNTVCK